MRAPATAPAEAECFTRQLHQAVLGGAAGLAEVLRTAREKLDLPTRNLPSMTRVKSSSQALEVLQQVLASVQADYSAALAPLTKPEINELASRCCPVFAGGNNVGHTLSDRNSGRRLCDLIEKLDRGAMQAAAEDMLPLMIITEEFRKQLDAIPEEGDVKVSGVSGRVLKKISTTSGMILVGGRDKNVYHLDKMTDVVAVIDLGWRR